MLRFRSISLNFADCHSQPFDWPKDDIIDVDNTPVAPYPDIPANMLGVQLDQSSQPTTSTPAPTTTDEPD
jgi:hypothetical protein